MLWLFVGPTGVYLIGFLLLRYSVLFAVESLSLLYLLVIYCRACQGLLLITDLGGTPFRPSCLFTWQWLQSALHLGNDPKVNQYSYALFQTKNQDGLIYVDVDLPNKTDANNMRPIIHGEDDRTIYAEVAFGQVGEPLPESDEEDTTEKQ